MTEQKRHQDTERNRLLNSTVHRLNAVINLHDPEVDVPINDGLWDILDEVTLERERSLLARAEAAEASAKASHEQMKARRDQVYEMRAERDALSARLAEVEKERDEVSSLAQDLLSRISTWKADHLNDDNFRDWDGHVEPAEWRLRAAVKGGDA